MENDNKNIFEGYQQQLNQTNSTGVQGPIQTSACPTCGYCPSCGRPNSYQRGYYPWWQYQGPYVLY